MCTFLIFFVCAHSYHPTSYFLLLHFSLTLPSPLSSLTLLSHSPLSLSTLTSYLIKISLILLVVCYFFVLLHAPNNNCKQKDLKYNGKQFS